MANAGRTKSQRRRDRERQRKKAAELFEQTMGPPPQIPEELIIALGVNTDLATPFDQKEPWERAPDHMVEWSECPGLITPKLADLREKAAESKACEKDHEISDLKRRHSDHWDKRGGAGIIARAEARAGNPISERTVRNYIARSKKK